MVTENAEEAGGKERYTRLSSLEEIKVDEIYMNSQKAESEKQGGVAYLDPLQSK